MPESMRANDFVDAIFFGEIFHDEKDHLTGETRTTTVQKTVSVNFGFGLMCSLAPSMYW